MIALTCPPVRLSLVNVVNLVLASDVCHVQWSLCLAGAPYRQTLPKDKGGLPAGLNNVLHQRSKNSRPVNS
jgi:hypothetical protein